MYENEGYRAKYEAAGIWYQHRLIDDMVAQAWRPRPRAVCVWGKAPKCFCYEERKILSCGASSASSVPWVRGRSIDTLSLHPIMPQPSCRLSGANSHDMLVRRCQGRVFSETGRGHWLQWKGGFQYMPPPSPLLFLTIAALLTLFREAACYSMA